MTVFDTDVFVEILLGSARLVGRVATIPEDQWGVTVVTLEEIMRGRLRAIRRIEAGKGTGEIVRAYELFQRSLAAFRHLKVLPYTNIADAQYRSWQKEKVRVSTHDLRIAAIVVAHSATLVSRNRRDFERIPGLSVAFWN